MVRFLFLLRTQIFLPRTNIFSFLLPFSASNSLRINNFETHERWCIRSCEVGERLVKTFHRWLVNMMNRWTWFHYRKHWKIQNKKYKPHHEHHHSNYWIELQLLQFFTNFEVNNHRCNNIHLKFILPNFEKSVIKRNITF